MPTDVPTGLTGVILAAGQGSRLRSAKLDLPKCLLEIGGKTIIDRQLNTLDALNILDVLVVVGYRGELIKRQLGNRVRYHTYNAWASSNNFLTLWRARNALQGGFVCLFADVICDSQEVSNVVKSPSDICALVDTSAVLAGTMRVQRRPIACSLSVVIFR